MKMQNAGETSNKWQEQWQRRRGGGESRMLIQTLPTDMLPASVLTQGKCRCRTDTSIIIYFKRLVLYPSILPSSCPTTSHLPSPHTPLQSIMSIASQIPCTFNPMSSPRAMQHSDLHSTDRMRRDATQGPIPFLPIPVILVFCNIAPYDFTRAFM